MKQVSLKVIVLVVHPGDGDSYTSVYRTREDAIDHLYEEYVSGNWSSTFDEDEDSIDDYTREDAIEHYYNYVGEGYYQIDTEFVTYGVQELQDEIAKAIGLATHG